MAKFERFAGLLNEVAAHQMLHRLSFQHQFNKIPALGLAAWCNNATDASNIAAGFDPYFKRVDTANASAPVFTINGLDLVTAGTAQADDCIVCPHTVDADSFFGTASILLLSGGYNIETTWAIKTGASIASVLFFIGNMMNIKSAIGGTAGDDQAFFHFDPDLSDNWLYETVVANSATEVDTGVVVTANTPYLLKAIHRASDYKTELYINGVYVGLTGANASTTDMYPVAAVETDTTAAKHLILRGVEVAIDYGLS